MTPTNIDDYQDFCQTTWGDHHGSGQMAEELHAVLGITGEAGEVAELYKKFIRGDSPLDQTKLIKELGDVMYYIVTLARLHGLKASEITHANIVKLTDRKARGVIRGSGDER